MGNRFQSNDAYKQKMRCEFKLQYDVMADTTGYYTTILRRGGE